MDPGEPALFFRAVPAQLRLPAEAQREFRAFARELSLRICEGRSFTCLVTNDKALRKLNREFLGHDYATDVLSFPSGSDFEMGDLAISVERAHSQAGAFGHSLLDELRVLLLHGVLHLAGYDHENDGGEMKRAERKWRAAFNLPHTLIARSSHLRRTVQPRKVLQGAAR